MDTPARPPRVTTPEFVAVYRAHSVFVWHSLRLLGIADEGVEDAAQDVFVVVHRRLHEFEGRAKVRTWIFEIVRRVAARHRERAQRDAGRMAELPEILAPGDPDAELDRTIASDILREFVATLDEDRLRVFVLAEFGQLRGSEIAKTLGLNLNTVYARLRSAHKDLDRLTKRLRAQETRAIVDAARGRRPSMAARRRAWAAIVAQLGLPTAVKTGAGLAGLGAFVKWIALGFGVIGAATVAAWASTTKEPPTMRAAEAQHPSPATAPIGGSAGEGAASGEVAADGPAGGGAESVAKTAVVPPDETPGVGVDRSAADMPMSTRERRARHDASRPSPAAASPELGPENDPAATHPTSQLAAEVALVKALRDGVGQPAVFSATLARYRKEHADGELRPEVDALIIEHDCRRGHAAGADAAIAAFERRWPQSSLPRRLKSTCAAEKGPQ